MFNSSLLKRGDYIVLTSLFSALAFIILFVYRAVDDNRLTSWKWSFAGIDVSGIFFILISGLIIAYLLSRVSLKKFNSSLFLFTASFASGMLFWAEPEVIIDASRYFTQAKHLEVYGIRYFIVEWGMNISAWTDLPLIPFLYGLIFKFFGESRVYIQIFTTALFSLTVLTTSKVGEKLWDKDTGFFAGCLMLGMPYVYTQIPLMLVDVPTMFFLMFAVYTYLKALEKGRSWIVISSCAIFLAFYSKYSAWLMLSVLVITTLVRLKDPPAAISRRTVLQRTSAIVFVSGYLISTLILLKFDLISEQVDLLLSYQRPGLKRWSESFVSSFFYQVHPFITIAAVYSIYSAVRKRDLKYAAISWLIVLVIILQIKRMRYIMITLPMFALMASYGLQSIRDIQARKFIVLCVVISSLVISFFVYLPFLQRMSPANLKHAGRLLNSIHEENIEVFTLPSNDNIINPAVAVPILDLFTEKKLFYGYNNSFSPSNESIKESPLRFTWEYANPAYYSDKDSAAADKAIVVISGESGQPLPDYVKRRTNGFHISDRFEISTGFFKYVTIAEIYRQDTVVP